MRARLRRLAPADITALAGEVLTPFRQRFGDEWDDAEVGLVVSFLAALSGQLLGQSFAHHRDGDFADMIRALNDQMWTSIRIGQREHVCDPAPRRRTGKMGPTGTP